MKKIAAFLLALSLIFTAAGCSSSPAASGSSGAAAPKEKTDLVFADVGWDSIKFHNAVAGLIGAIVLWCSWNVWPQSASIAVSICLIVGVRMGSLKWHIQMPVAGGRDEQTRD